MTHLKSIECLNQYLDIYFAIFQTQMSISVIKLKRTTPESSLPVSSCSKTVAWPWAPCFLNSLCPSCEPPTFSCHDRKSNQGGVVLRCWSVPRCTVGHDRVIKQWRPSPLLMTGHINLLLYQVEGLSHMDVSKSLWSFQANPLLARHVCTRKLHKDTITHPWIPSTLRIELIQTYTEYRFLWGKHV